MRLLYTADIYVSFLQKNLEFEFFVSASFRIPIEHPKIVAGSSTLPHTSFMSVVRGASNLGWVMMARHRPNLARDDTMTIIKYSHFHYIDSTLTSSSHPALAPISSDVFRFRRFSWVSFRTFPVLRWSIFHVHALHLVGFDVEVFFPLERLPATANESVLSGEIHIPLKFRIRSCQCTGKLTQSSLLTFQEYQKVS